MALNTVKLDGQSAVLNNLNREIGKIKKGAENGVLRALLAIEKTAIPLTPLDKGPLRSSLYKDIIDRKDVIFGEIGYTVKYAPFVHENLEAAHPIGQAKFLEEAIRINQQRIIRLIDGEIDL